jgi:hypothetical protein
MCGTCHACNKAVQCYYYTVHSARYTCSKHYYYHMQCGHSTGTALILYSACVGVRYMHNNKYTTHMQHHYISNNMPFPAVPVPVQ